MQSRSMFGRVFVAHGSEQVKKNSLYEHGRLSMLNTTSFIYRHSINSLGSQFPDWF